MEHRHTPVLLRRRRLAFAFGFILLTSTLYFGFSAHSAESIEEHRSVLVSHPEETRQCGQPKVKDEDEFNPLSYLVGPPTQSFRDNLRNDTKYITSFYGAGWSTSFLVDINARTDAYGYQANDVMTMVNQHYCVTEQVTDVLQANLIYLAKITDRIPIIPAFTPMYHVGDDWELPAIPFGDIFDVPRLSKELGLPVLEWHQVKNPDSEEIDDYGCWSVWSVVQTLGDGRMDGPRRNRAPLDIGLDISYTPVPDWVPERRNFHTRFWKLAPLTFPGTYARSIREKSPIPSERTGLTLPPDEQVACFDYLYFVGAFEEFEFEHEWSPSWRHVLKHCRWTSKVENLAMYYLRRALRVPPSADIPPYIAIHSRHGDFGIFCGDIPDGVPAFIHCFVSVSRIAESVSEIQQELLERDGVTIPNSHVIMTSDETDPAWWDLVASHGYTWVDFKKERVVETLGAWYPTFIDAVIQSGGAGFVGTEESTMSLIAARRTRDWHGGVTRFVPRRPS
ncbi:hypothetical protein OE88DRAFT_1803321 [Heliocybe sulcata]|uniref:Uncharacterized protein n=1 Tax=Heliocybe sulcata TaxID=5364 RepID=A0A5C3NIJ5_9AGAM|nr:hypothetical protein OE88DRAFT_1803321 [Heliocybe sulcata]